jgi:hypothetical protein
VKTLHQIQHVNPTFDKGFAKLSARDRVRPLPYSSAHNGLLNAAVKLENIRLKLGLTRISPLEWVSTE